MFAVFYVLLKDERGCRVQSSNLKKQLYYKGTNQIQLTELKRYRSSVHEVYDHSVNYMGLSLHVILGKVMKINENVSIMLHSVT